MSRIIHLKRFYDLNHRCTTIELKYENYYVYEEYVYMKKPNGDINKLQKQDNVIRTEIK